MRYILSLLFLSICTFLSGQLTIDLITSANSDITKVHVFNTEQDAAAIDLSFKDSMRITLPLKIDSQINIQYFTSSGKMIRPRPIWLDTGSVKIVIEISEEEVKTIDVIGSEADDLYVEYMRSTLAKTNDPVLYRMENMMFWIRAQDLTLSGLMMTNYENHFQNEPAQLREALKFMNSQSDEIKKDFIWDSTYRSLKAKLENDSLGINEFAFINTENKVARLELSKGKITVLDLWFVACPPCVADHELILSDIETGRLDTIKINLIGLSIDHDFEQWRNYLSRHNIPWDNYKDYGDSDRDFFEEVGVMGFPTYFILDDTGKILKTFNGYVMVQMELARMAED